MRKAVWASLLVGVLLVAFFVLPGCQPQPVQAPTPAQVPTSTPRGEDFHFSGVIESMGQGGIHCIA
ncbi:MAG: hypothetical protein HY671_06515 [Chloroflexi bacterium]|nr:hypothetical protein [Chloroflexota bacterium]